MRFASPKTPGLQLGPSSLPLGPSSLPPAPAPPQSVAPPPRWLTPQRWLVLSMGAALALLTGAVLFLLWRPTPVGVTPEAFDRAVETYLRQRPPGPTPANIAFAVVQPSLVLIRAGQDGGRNEGSSALGTGIIVDEAGTIMTCYHVIEGAQDIRLVFQDGFETAGLLIRTQASNDLAVLRPEVVPEDLIPVTFGNSGDLQIGDPVVAVGHPFGLVNSVSEGVVSALGRTTGEGPRRLSNLIQFDAAVNPGNSGGPLLNRQGEVVGLVTALLNPTKQSFFVGIGYAVTIETAGGALDIPPW